MDSLLASYASSDDEDDDKEEKLQPQNLPSNPRQPQATVADEEDGQKSPPRRSRDSQSLFASLPQPKSSLFSTVPAPRTRGFSSLTSSGPGTKRVVQFRPPPMDMSSNSANDDEDEDEDEDNEKKEKQKTDIQTSSVRSLFSSMPAPKNSATLGALPSASGFGRRSMLEADVPAVIASDSVNTVKNEITSVSEVTGSIGERAVQSSVGDPNEFSGWASGGENYISYDVNASYTGSGGDGDYDWGGGSGEYGNYGSAYGSAADVQYESNTADGSNTGVEWAESSVGVTGKRGRNEVPTEIIEVNQDELMKNRPREDQTKLTGIAFGPSYQPVSTKGKPSKLHKRKHQIGSLYFDMKQNEQVLAERRSRGLLTKSQTQGKYGW